MGLLVGLAAFSAHAEVVNLDTSTTYETFAEAYSAASNGDTLELGDGTYALSSFALDKEVDIRARNMGEAVIAGDGVATGYPVIISADMTFSGVRFTSATAAFSLRDQDITVQVEDAVFHGMNHGVTHQNLFGGTIGQIIITRATFHDLVEEAVYVNNGGPVVVNDSVFVDVPGLGLLLGDNEGAATLQVTDYALADTPNTVTDPSLATLTGLVDGESLLADPEAGYFALVAGSAGADEGFGIGLDPAPRVTVAVTGNGNVVANGATTTAADNLTDFGSMHVSDSQVHRFSIANAGYADDLSLVRVDGETVRIDGDDAAQFSVLAQPPTDAIAPQGSTTFEIRYSPVAVGPHQTNIVFNNNVDDPFVYRVSGVADNADPVANDDTATIDEDASATVSVLGNDTDADGDDLTVSSATLVSGWGSVTHQPTTIEYVPDADFNGPASILYEATDGYATDSATVDITVSPINDAPVAADDTSTTDEDTLVVIDALANDTDVDGDALTITSASVTSGSGNVIVAEGLLEYLPEANGHGDNVLGYVISDGTLTDSAQVLVTVTAVNDAPVATADSATTAEDTTVTIDVLANDTDVDGDALSITGASVTSGAGSVVVSGDVLDFTPAADSTADAVLSYTVSDGALTDTGTVSVAITPVNDAPVANPDSATTAEDTLVTIDVLANDTDVDGDTLSISSASLQSGAGSVRVTGDALEFTPAADDTGDVTLSYVVTDGALTDTATVAVTITPVNDAPVANADAATTAEDTAVRIDVLANDTDVDGDALSITGASVTRGGGSVIVNGDALEFTPATDNTAEVALSYSVSDGELTDTGTVLVTITPVNDAPVASADSATTAEDSPVLIDVLANDSDVDGDGLTIASATVQRGEGSVTMIGGRLEFTPATNATGEVTLSYVVSDGELSDSAQVTVVVTAVNDAPTAVADSATTAEDTAVVIDVLANDSDVEGDALSIVAATVEAGVGAVRVLAGALEFTPGADDTSGATLSYVVSDGAANSTATVSVTVTPVNDAPVAGADTSTTPEDTSVLIDVLANDTDVDGDALTVASATVESGSGSVAVQGDQLAYTPAPNSTDDAVLRYVVSDGELTATGRVSVSVSPVNDAPVAVDDSATTAEDTAVVIDVLANDGDVDGDGLSVASAAVAAGGGNVSVDTGALVFTPAADSVDDVTIRYVVTDGGLTDEAVVVITITPVNDPPIARPDSIRGHHLDAITIDVLANDGDVDSNNLFLTAASAEQGDVAIVDNRLVFSLNGDWVAQARLNYTVSDGELEAVTSVTVDLDEYRAPLVIGSGEKTRRSGTLAESAFSDIYSIVVGVSAQVFTADADVFRAIDIAGDRVTDIIRNASGHQDGSIRDARFGNIEGLAYDAANGFVYISEVGKGTIRRFDLRRDTVNTIRSGIVQPLGMALSNDGNTLYVIEHGKARVLALDLLNGVDSVLVGDGNRGFADGVGESARINVSVDLTVGPDGTVYLADRGNSRLRAINPATREIRTLSSDFTRPTDVVVRDANTLMVLDRHENVIKRFDLATNTATVVASTVDALSGPIAMDIDAAGTLYVVDFGNSQIKAFGVDTLERTQSLAITNPQEVVGDAQQGSYFIRDVVGTGYRGAVGGVSRQANLNDPDQVAIGGENILYHSNRQLTLMRTDLTTGRTVSVFPDYATNTLVEASAYGLGVSRWGHIDGLTYSAADNRLYVFAGRNTLFNINLDDNSFRHVTVSGLSTGGDFTLAFDGTLYMVDSGADRIVQIDPDTGAILETFESRDGVTLDSPTDIDIASNGDLYIANWGLREVVKLVPATGELSHYIFRNNGFADGSLGSAVIGGVYGLEFGDNNVLYMADRLNHAVRMVDIRGNPPILRTMAGDGTAGVLSDGGARFNNPTSLAVDFNGTVVVTDDGNHRIRLVGTNLSRPLSPFDAPIDLLGTKPDGSPIVEGTLPLSDFPIIRNSPVLQAAVAPIPMLLVDADERVQEHDDVTYTTLEGDVTIDIPAGVNGGAFRVNGARLMAYSTEELNDDEIETNNAFFIKVSLRRFTASFLQAQAGGEGAISDAQLSAIVAVLPDIEMLIAYSDKNLDSTPIEDLPQNLQDFFAGIFSPRYGVPIFNDQGSLNAFLATNFNSLPAMVRDPLDFLGINQQFISDEIGLDGSILTSAAVENIGFMIDVIGFVFPALQSEVAKDGSDFGIPKLNVGLILPGLSLPAFMRDAASAFPLFQIIGFEPDPGVQLRYFMGLQPEALLGAEFTADVGVEGALLANMPNILNANALRDDPGAQALETRINLTAFVSGSVGVAGGSVGLADGKVGISGSLQLVNYWNNPFGIQGIGFGDASILIGGQGAAGAAVQNVGAGVDIFGGISGQFACLDENDDILGLPSKAAVYFGFKVGVPPLPTGFGVEMSPGPGGMTFGDHMRCRVRLFNSLVLGLGDTLLGALPPGPERDAIQAIQDSATGSFAEFERILFTPLDFEPVRALLDGVRFAGDLYLATPGVELPNGFGAEGLRSGGRLEIRESTDAPWVAIADALIDIQFDSAMRASFGLQDYNIADLIVMQDVQGEFDLQFSQPLEAELNLTGSQTFFDLQSDTSIDMSVRNGVTIDSRTAIDRVGEAEITAATTGSLDNWPPVGPGGGIDFAGQARFDLDTNAVADELHGAVNSVLNDANSAYREALDVLTRATGEEQALQAEINRLESEIRSRTDEINRKLRPGFEDAKRRLSNARRHVSNLWSDIRYYEREKDYNSDRCSWPPHTWKNCGAAAYWWGREKATRALVGAANVAIDLADAAVSRAEDSLDDALYEVARTLSPRLNTYRLAIVGLRTSRDLAAITVRSLQAANSEVQGISNALRDASNIRVHDASASIDSLFNVYAGRDGLNTNLDIEVLNLRCRAAVEVNLNNPVATLMGGIEEIQRACVSDLHADTAARKQATLRKQYFASRLASAVGLSASTSKAGNDAVDAAEVITAGVPVRINADNTNAATAADEYAADRNTHTLWWTWQPPSSGLYRISALSGATDTTLQLHRLVADAPSADTLIAADFIPARDAVLQVRLEAGQDYVIGVGSQLGLPGAFTLAIDALDAPTAPPNDDVANAIALTGLGGSTGQSNLGATVEPGETAGDALAINATLWWALTAADSGLYTINTLGSDVDTVVRAYRHDGGGAPTVADLVWQKTADDVSIDPRSELTIVAEAGEVLWFSIASKTADRGQIAFNWQHTDAAPLQGDDFAQPIVLDVGGSGAVYSNRGATTQAGEPLHAGASNASSLWYRFTPAESGNYRFDTTGSDVDVALALYAGTSLDALTPLASSTGTRGFSESLTRIRYSSFRANLQAGQPVHLAVAGLSEAEGDVVINAQRFALNDTFDNPVTIAPDGGQYAADISDAVTQPAEPDYAEILARDVHPDVLLADFAAAGDAASGAGIDATVDPELVNTLGSLYDDALADLRARPTDRSLWYRYVASESGDLVLRTLGSEPDTALILFTGDALGNLEAVAWSDDTDNGTDSRLRHGVTDGETYVIALVARSPGLVRLTAELFTPDRQSVANDTPQTATMLTGATGSATADNTYATDDASVARLTSQQDGQWLWWRFDATADGVLIADTEGSASDTLMAVYGDDFGALERITLNDNFHPDLTSSRVGVAVAAGRSYWIAVDTLRGGAGPVTLNHRFVTTAVGPANDAFAQAGVLSGAAPTVTASNVFAQHQVGEPAIGAVLRPNLVWYQWTPATSGLATISTQGSAFDTVVGLFLGTSLGTSLGTQASDLQLLASNDDGPDGDGSSVVQAHVAADVTYYIGIAGKRDVQGSYTLSVSVAENGGQQADNTAIGAAVGVSGPAPVFGGALTHTLPAADTGSELVVPSGQEASSRWWQWRAPASGAITVSSQGSDVVPQLEIYQGETPSTIVLLDADKGSGGDGAFSRVTATVDAGSNYYIRITSPFSFQGDVTLTIAYVDGPVDDTPAVLTGDSGAVAAAIRAAGSTAWEWTAPDTGMVQFALSRGGVDEHVMQAFALAGGTPVAVDNALPVTGDEANASVQFVATQGVSYQIVVTSTQPLLGNAELQYSYISRQAVNLDSDAARAFIAALRPLVSTGVDAQGVTVPVLAASDATVAALLAELLAGTGLSGEQLAVSLTASRISAGTVGPERVRFVARDATTGVVVLSVVFDPALDAPAAVRHAQVLVNNPRPTEIRFPGEDDGVVGLQMDASSFNSFVAQAFVSAERVDLAGRTITSAQDLLLGTTAYAITLDLYDAAGQRYAIENDPSVLRSVAVQLPVDPTVLRAWLGADAGEPEQAQALIDRAVAQGLLAVVRASSVDALLAGDTALVNGTLAIDLTEGRMVFTTDHFSAFALVALRPASDIEPDPPTPDDGGAEPVGVDVEAAGTMNPGALILLLALCLIARGRRRAT